ncbi:hypothetical protein E2C01_057739 [Portunus trituberculatus]|uniref:Uncharacterized protein n=1 Tax=Portunus trituberculatus TaxID=210409 RepID=A0A5B7H3G3_PORTR|nr:hypothetical protein [Portunus trituberculatus]
MEVRHRYSSCYLQAASPSGPPPITLPTAACGVKYFFSYISKRYYYASMPSHPIPVLSDDHSPDGWRFFSNTPVRQYFA